MKEGERLKIYDMLRQFHKNKLIPLIWAKEDLSNWDKEVLETLSGVLYMAESVFAKEDT